MKLTGLIKLTEGGSVMSGIMSDDERLIIQWGMMARHSGVYLGYPSQIPTARLTGSTIPSVKMTDEEYMLADAAVSALISQHPAMGVVILSIYRDGKTQRETARIKKISRDSVSELRRSGLAFISGVLYLSQRQKTAV